MARIGVEPTLTQVKEALMEMGHEVVDVHTEQDVAQCDCCVISGQDKDMMGVSDTFLEGPVINAQGQSAADVAQEVNDRFS
ncbi:MULTISPECIES: YkuS family protein [unclassified Virgibacillus]|uniref:YkuS family protein n=1 Tax=unclassified Virgibacillus TaxID=2620237 RepID=UPI0024DE7FA8|nr:YkuS family protein [Virgibacillus sp. LDC-1]